MLILLSNTSNEPLYEQIYNQIVQQILDRNLIADEALASIRQLAKELKVSVITVKKAYEMLESAGFIYTRQGIGCFVAGAGEVMVKERLINSAETVFEGGIMQLIQAGLSDVEIMELFNTVLMLVREE